MANAAHREDPTFAKQAIEEIKGAFENAVLECGEFQGQAWAVIDREQIVDVCYFLRDHEKFRFDYMRDLCGVDNLNHVPFDKRFQVVYQLYSLSHRQGLRLKVNCPEEDPVVDSVVPVWTAADWQEREAFDMYGIRFRGHPNLIRILMPEDYQHHPQRKDFPIEGIHEAVEV